MTRMKESGIDWIGQIPEEWEVTKLKYALLISNGKDYKDIEVEEGGYPVIGSGGVFARARNYMYDGDVVLLGRKGTIDKPLFYSGKFWTVDTMFYSTALNGNNIKFMYYSSLLIPFSYYSTATALPSMTQSDLNNHVLCLPSVSEQQKIADFLDKKTAQLDKVKVLLEEQIQKLKDYRASLIYETVTKGLDKTVPMKDSGVDWIGQIPQGWEISKIRYLVTTRSEKRITDSSIPYIGLENIESQTGKFVETGIQVDKSENIVVEIGDVLFGKLRPYLRKYWRATFPSTASSEFLVFQSSELDMNFLYYAIQSDSFIEEVNTSTYGSKMPRASWEYIKNMKIAFPSSLVEQQKIADFLDKKTILIDKLIQIKNEQIDNINKQRQTLIYDCVTGKRRV